MKILTLSKEQVVNAIRAHKVSICIVGLGHIGLPLAVLMANEGGKIVGCDIDKDYIDQINRGKTGFLDYDVSDLVRMNAKMVNHSCPSCGVRLFNLESETFCPYCGRVVTLSERGVTITNRIAIAHLKIFKREQRLEERLREALSTGFYATLKTAEEIRNADVILITVGTPIDENNIPDYTALQNASHTVGQNLQKNSLVIIKSTVSPGTTETLVQSILEAESGWKAGTDFGLAFMPETVYEGQTLHDLRELPRIVGGLTNQCAQAATNVFSIFPAPIYIFNNPSIVETAKLFMNIYRDTNIALVNELAIICEKLGIDVIQAINAANIERKTHLLVPGLVGGYCLPKDTYHLAYPAEQKGFHPNLILTARKLNKAMPGHVLRLIDDAFREMNILITNEKIAVLGLGFKANNGNLRNTQATPIIQGLQQRRAKVVAHDPFVNIEEVLQLHPDLEHVSKIEEALNKARCVVIITDHSLFRQLTVHQMQQLMLQPCAIVDARHIIDPKEAAAYKVIFRGLGKPSSLN
jgi:UDP-N-acetyl-D-mannosaminuronic acid dehydrogenase